MRTRLILTRLRSLVQQRFVRDTLIFQIGQFVIIFIAGGAQIVIARTLQKDLLGLYRLALNLFSLVALLNISGTVLISRNVLAKAFGADDQTAIREVFGWLLKVNLIVNVGLAVFFMIVFPIIGGEAGRLAAVLSLMAITDIPYNIVQNSLVARRMAAPVVRLEASRLIMLAILQVGAALSLRVDWLVGVQVAVSVVFGVYSVFYYRRLARDDGRLPTWRTMIADAQRVRFTQYLKQGVLISLDKNLSDFTVDKLPLLMLGAYSQAELGLFSTAYQVITFPSPLIGGLARNLESYLPFRSNKQGALRETFIYATLASALFWSLGTVALAFIAPFVLLLLFGEGYVGAVGWLYPLLLQSLAVGFGVGLGSAFRTLNKSAWSIGESLVITAIMLPIGYWLIQNYGGLGAAWFIGLQWALNSVAGVLLILWFTRKQPSAASPQAS